jgi:hypothetical protein
LLALNMAVAAASAMVIVNTVVLVQADFGFSALHRDCAGVLWRGVDDIGADTSASSRQNE